MAWSWGLGPGPVLAAGRAARRGHLSPPVAPWQWYPGQVGARRGSRFGSQSLGPSLLLRGASSHVAVLASLPWLMLTDAIAGQSSLFSGKALRLLSCMNPDPWSRPLSRPVSRSEGCFYSPGTCSQACCWAAGPELLPVGLPCRSPQWASLQLEDVTARDVF